MVGRYFRLMSPGRDLLAQVYLGLRDSDWLDTGKPRELLGKGPTAGPQLGGGSLHQPPPVQPRAAQEQGPTGQQPSLLVARRGEGAAGTGCRPEPD